MIRNVAYKLDGVFKQIEEVTADAPTPPTPSFSPEVEDMLDDAESIIKGLPTEEEITDGDVEAAKAKADQAAAQLKDLQDEFNEGTYTAEEKAALEQAIADAEAALKAAMEKIAKELQSQVQEIVTELPTKITTVEEAEAAQKQAEEATAKLEAIKDLIEQGGFSEADKEALGKEIAAAEEAIKAVEETAKHVLEAEAAKPVVKNVTSLTNDTVTIEFNMVLDEKTATDTNNYKIENLAIISAKPSITADGTQIVTLKIGENKKTGEHEIKISNLKSKDGVEMKHYNGKVDLKENIQPTVVSAEYVSFGTIEVTFSEDVAAGSAADFVLSVGGQAVQTTVTTETQATATDNVLVLTLGTPVTAADLAQGLSLNAATTLDIVDSVGNKLSVPTAITVAQ